MLLKRRFLIAVLSTLTVTCAHDRARAPSGEEHAPLDEIRSLRSGGNDPLSEIRTESTEHEEAPRSSIVADEELPPSALAAAPAKPSVHAESRRARTPVYDLDKTGTRPSTAAKMRPAEAPAGSRAAPAAPALKAGRHDDNKEYNRFLAFLAQNEGFREYSTDINERLLVRALDRDGRSLPNCPVAVKSTSGKVLAQTTTYADGSTQFFPAAVDSPKDDSYVVQVKCGDRIRNGQLARAGGVTMRFASILRARYPRQCRWTWPSCWIRRQHAGPD